MTADNIVALPPTGHDHVVILLSVHLHLESNPNVFKLHHIFSLSTVSQVNVFPVSLHVVERQSPAAVSY